MQAELARTASDSGKYQLVFVHGAGESSGVWRHQTPAFPRATFLDLPGHGRERDAFCNSIRDYAVWVRQFLAERGINDVALVGHSMGGAVTIELALMYPGIVKSIVLVGTGAKLRVSSLILDGLRNDTESAFRTILEWSFWARESVAKTEFERILRATPVNVTLRDYMACNNFDRMTSIEEISCRCLAVCGSEDRMTPPKFSQYLVKQIRNSLLALLPDAGHMVMMEQPGRFNDALSDFLNAH